MNRIIILYVLGDEYNKMLKWNSVEQFKEALINNAGLPNKDDIITEAYIDDNLIDVNNTFEITLSKLKLILGFDF